MQKKFGDARAIVDWCNTKLSTRTNDNSIIKRFFWLVEENDILTRQDCETINGSAKWHSFKSSNANTWTIWTRELACFCQYYIASGWEACENIEWVEEWQQRALSPTSTYVQHETTIEDNQVFA